MSQRPTVGTEGGFRMKAWGQGTGPEDLVWGRPRGPCPPARAPPAGSAPLCCPHTPFPPGLGKLHPNRPPPAQLLAAGSALWQ